MDKVNLEYIADKSGLKEQEIEGPQFGVPPTNAIRTVAGNRMDLADSTSLGMVVSAGVANALGMFSGGDLYRLKEVLGKGRLQTKLPDYVQTERAIEEMNGSGAFDKDKLVWAFPQRIGVPYEANGDYFYGVDESVVRFALDKCR
jgi:3-dehydroquinate synthetase